MTGRPRTAWTLGITSAALSSGPATRLDLPGLGLASLGLLGIVLGVVRGNDHGWTSERCCRL